MEQNEEGEGNGEEYIGAAVGWRTVQLSESIARAVLNIETEISK